jgi:hypothetical protein
VRKDLNSIEHEEQFEAYKTRVSAAAKEASECEKCLSCTVTYTWCATAAWALLWTQVLDTQSVAYSSDFCSFVADSGVWVFPLLIATNACVYVLPWWYFGPRKTGIEFQKSADMLAQQETLDIRDGWLRGTSEMDGVVDDKPDFVSGSLFSCLCIVFVLLCWQLREVLSRRGTGTKFDPHSDMLVIDQDFGPQGSNGDFGFGFGSEAGSDDETARFMNHCLSEYETDVV